MENSRESKDWTWNMKQSQWTMCGSFYVGKVNSIANSPVEKSYLSETVLFHRKIQLPWNSFYSTEYMCFHLSTSKTAAPYVPAYRSPRFFLGAPRNPMSNGLGDTLSRPVRFQATYADSTLLTSPQPPIYQASSLAAPISSHHRSSNTPGRHMSDYKDKSGPRRSLVPKALLYYFSSGMEWRPRKRLSILYWAAMDPSQRLAYPYLAKAPGSVHM